MSEPSLRITEIFFSLQGESRSVGWPTVFVRLTGCPMRCTYCDTAYAFSGGEQKTLANIINEVRSYTPRFVTVTGGEPLAQAECLPLLKALCDEAYEVSLETGGAISTHDVDPRVSVVLDVKTPDSGELEQYQWRNIDYLRANDQLKFVLCSRSDYEWARDKLASMQLADKVSEVLFSPSFGQLDARELAEWVLADGLNVRMQMQMHKLIWGDVPGH